MVDEQQITNKKLSKELKADYNARNKVIKLLLLGTGKVSQHYNNTMINIPLRQGIYLFLKGVGGSDLLGKVFDLKS